MLHRPDGKLRIFFLARDSIPCPVFFGFAGHDANAPLWPASPLCVKPRAPGAFTRTWPPAQKGFNALRAARGNRAVLPCTSQYELAATSSSPNRRPRAWSRKVGTGFRKRSCSDNKLERDDDSKKSHPALGTSHPEGKRRPVLAEAAEKKDI
jgi:hypothetical protein